MINIQQEESSISELEEQIDSLTRQIATIEQTISLEKGQLEGDVAKLLDDLKHHEACIVAAMGNLGNQLSNVRDMIDFFGGGDVISSGDAVAPGSGACADDVIDVTPPRFCLTQSSVAILDTNAAAAGTGSGSVMNVASISTSDGDASLDRGGNDVEHKVIGYQNVVAEQSKVDHPQQMRNDATCPSSSSTTSVAVLQNASQDKAGDDSLLSVPGPEQRLVWNQGDTKLLDELMNVILKGVAAGKYSCYGNKELKGTSMPTNTVQHRYLVVSKTVKKLKCAKFHQLLNEGKVGLAIFNRDALSSNQDEDMNRWTQFCSAKNVPYIFVRDWVFEDIIKNPKVYAEVLTSVSEEHQPLFAEICKLARLKFAKHPFYANPSVMDWCISLQEQDKTNDSDRSNNNVFGSDSCASKCSIDTIGESSSSNSAPKCTAQHEMSEIDDVVTTASNQKLPNDLIGDNLSQTATHQAIDISSITAAQQQSDEECKTSGAILDTIAGSVMNAVSASYSDISLDRKRAASSRVGNGVNEGDHHDAKRRKVNDATSCSSSSVVVIPQNTSQHKAGDSSFSAQTIQTPGPKQHLVWNQDDTKLLDELMKDIRKKVPRIYSFFTKKELKDGSTSTNTGSHRFLAISKNNTQRKCSKFMQLLKKGKVGLVMFNRNAFSRKLCCQNIDMNRWTQHCTKKKVPYVFVSCVEHPGLMDPTISIMVLTSVSEEHQPLFAEICKLACLKFAKHPFHANPSVTDWYDYLQKYDEGNAISNCPTHTNDPTGSLNYLLNIESDRFKCWFATVKTFENRVRDRLDTEMMESLQKFLGMSKETFHLFFNHAKELKGRTGLVVCNLYAYDELLTNHTPRTLKILPLINVIPHLCAKYGVPYVIVNCNKRMQKRGLWVFGAVFEPSVADNPLAFNDICERALLNFNGNSNIRGHSFLGW
eukprot:CAMPEP_0116018736 /NCGR_PEP_ID=MMETSP0321-20121206/8821_1 /TAXON_ID=163516 /ORGANISM="Leptocylindrus danicus var. danicus, Strain B650" /LENGTH=930 /DNA_ID=CAMNT_0003489177 /DNA_START=1717 /DNA_END=4506 /DNA_ORIENTATION=+